MEGFDRNLAEGILFFSVDHGDKTSLRFITNISPSIL